VIRKIRERGGKTRILQMPMAECNGKFSYPEEMKLALFRHAYGQFQPWHEQVFFYLCMESAALWNPVFGHGYRSNEQFELAMQASYLGKIRKRRASLALH
jgi:spore photoproduct lyase